MSILKLKYGCNPNQSYAQISGDPLPITVLNGIPSYINLLDALNAYQLVSELKIATKLPCATSFKHLSPTSAAIAQPLEDSLIQAYFLDSIQGLNDSPIATAYARARGADRMSSFGDFVALSDPCDLTCAQILSQEVSDGIIAPSFTPEAFDILRQKKGGNYAIFQIDANYCPPKREKREVYGITFEQDRNDLQITPSLLSNVVTAKKDLPQEAKQDLLLSLITLKYTQSNSIVLAYKGQAIGVGAGQQSRIHCTKIASDKADLWQLRSHPKVLALPFVEGLKRPTKDNLIYAYLTHGLSPQDQVCFYKKPEPFMQKEKEDYLATIKGVSLGSDAFFPFADSILRAQKSGVSYIAQSGGSKQDEAVIKACDELGLVMVFTKIRLFHH